MYKRTMAFLRSPRRFWPALCTLFALCALAPVQAEQVEWVNGQEVMSHEVMVRFRPATALATKQILANEDIDGAQGIGGAGVVLMHSRRKGAAALSRELSARPDVLYAEPNYVIRTDSVPNDPSFGSLWGLRNTGQVIGGVAGTPGADISATLAWDISTGSRANVVAVIDSGIDYNHPDLAANVWSAPRAYSLTIGGVLVNFRAGSHGYNAVTNTDDPFDDNNHGTHCSGTIGAVGNNALGVAGVNWTASIMGCKFLNAAGSGTTAGAINAIEYTIQVKKTFGAAANVRVLSNSWGGGGFSQALLDEINLANASDMLFVAAAGNDYLTNNDVVPHYPSSYNTPNMVAVAATTNTDGLASFSNYGPTTVHLGAPGQDILSTIPGAAYAFFSGTSMATPHVSGAAALILSKVNLTTADLKAILLNNVDPIASLTGLTITGGRLNVSKAIRAAAPAPPVPDYALSANPASQTVLQGAGAGYTVTATPSGGFTGTVTFSVSGLPAGASAGFSPASVVVPASSTLRSRQTIIAPQFCLRWGQKWPECGAVILGNCLSVTTSPTTPVGSYPLTVTGTSGALSRTTTVTLVVSAPATTDFSLSATPATQTVFPGLSVNYTVNIARSGGFAGAVTFSVSGLPAGSVVSFSPNPTPGAAATLTITTDAAAPFGSYPLTITGVSGALTRTTGVILVLSEDQ